MRETVVIVLLSIAVAQSQHISEDTLMKLTSKKADVSISDEQSIEVESSTVADTETTEMKVLTKEPELPSVSQTEKPEDSSPTPTPKLVTSDTLSDKNGKEKDNATTTQPESLPSPDPVQIVPVTINAENPKCKTEIKKSSNTSVPKKGVVYCGPSVLPRKGVGVENENATELMTDSSSTVGFTHTPQINDSALVTVPPKTAVNGKSSDSVHKSMSTDLNKLTTGIVKKTFPSNGNEANMDFSTSSTYPSVAMPSVPTATTQGLVPSPRPVDPEPEKPPIVNPSSTEGYSPLHFKPTAATDSLDMKGISSDNDNISYTPAVVGIVLLVAIVVTVMIVGYRRLQDVWMRRHYARMDFLIDGMYDV